MRTAIGVLGWILLVVAAGLLLLTVASLPSGGLMFALPYFFLIPGLIFAALGGLLLRLARSRPSA